MLHAQAPASFKYQAVIRDAGGQFVASHAVSIEVKILQGSASGNVVFSEVQNTQTNAFGMVSLLIGTGSSQTGSIAGIDWTAGPYFMESDVDPAGGTNYQVMGTSQLLAVPYAMYANKTGFSDKLQVMPSAAPVADSALFEVKDHLGQIVFAVYESGVKIYLNAGAKGGQGGFAIGGRTPGKGTVQNIFNASLDSVRVYIDTTTAKGGQGGFAVGGRDQGNKGELPDYFSITNSKIPRIINPSKPGILWYPTKSSFLAGQVLVESPDSVGPFSIAVGDSAKAIGTNSQAFGYRPIARANYSTAIGNNALATGNVSFALGSGAQASADYSFAFGSTGLNEDGTASGSMTQASGMYSFAFGMGSSSSGYGSFSYGMNCNASGDYSTALGLGASASGTCATALGYYNSAQSYKSTVLGTYNTLSSSYSTTSWVGTDPLFVLGNGTGGYQFIKLLNGKKGILANPILISGIIRPPILTINRSNAFMVFKNGDAILGGGSTYTADQATRFFVYKSIGSSSAYNYNAGITIKESNAYDYGHDMVVYDKDNYTKLYIAAGNPGYPTLFVSNINSSAAYALYVVGNAYITGSWSGSDERWKKNIIPMSNVLDKVMQLDPVHYEWRTREFPEMNFSDGEQMGVIAQQTEKIFPELVKTDNKGYKAVAYDKLSVVAISAIQQQQKEITELRSQVQLLQQENEKLMQLQSRLEALEKQAGK